MPEGHTVHRIANAFEQEFKGKPVTVDSPQGRFTASAKLISGKKLLSATAVGKQMFLHFEGSRIVRIHLGIYGKYRWEHGNAKAFLKEPVKGEVRVRFYNSSTLTELRGPTVCEVIDQRQMNEVLNRLGPDPLNPDDGSQRQRFIGNIQKSKTAIGLLLMDQKVVSGIGNVYRAELLFRAGINPYLAGNRLSEEQLHELWDDSVALLKVGVKTGFMITREELFEKNPAKEDRNFVYKREGRPCRVCETKVSLAIEGGRKLYWCSRCQK